MTVHHEIERLRSRVETSPGDATFPLLAEALRRVGSPKEAMDVAATGLAHSPNNMEGRVALGLALLDLGDLESARQELAEVIERLPGSQILRTSGEPDAAFADVEHADLVAGEPRPELTGELEGEEIDRAFELAEPEEDQMLSANTIAERAIEHTLAQDEDEHSSPVHGSPAFMTETMAHLLERQGDVRGAQAIRSALEEDVAKSGGDAAEVLMAPAPEIAADPDPDRAWQSEVVTKLESWLRNIRRGAE